MQIGLNTTPLLPLFPVEPDRQATYPRALGPVFVGTPYLKLSAAKSSFQVLDLPAGTGVGTTGSAGEGRTTALAGGHLGTRLDLLA